MNNHDKSVETNHTLICPCTFWLQVVIMGCSGSSNTAVIELNKALTSRCGFKDPFESTYQLLIDARDKVEIKYTKNPRVLIDYF